MGTRTLARGAAIILGIAASGCQLPRDAEGTLEHIESGGELRVGVSENPPWVRFEGAEPRGIEPALIQRWADQLGAHVRWVRGAESELVDALAHREIDVLVAGLTDDTPWAAKLGVSRPYLSVAVRVGSPEGAPSAWKGHPITVDPDDAQLAALVRRNGGLPVSPTSGEATPFRAGYDFQLAAAGLGVTDPPLSEEKHIIAVKPGENALLLHLDKFLQTTGRAAIWATATEEARR